MAEQDRIAFKKYTKTCLVLLLALAGSCGISKNFPEKFYAQNESRLVGIKTDFQKLHAAHPFSVLFEERTFSNISFEFIEDSIKYIYHFNINGPAFKDSLIAHHYDPAAVIQLINDMRSIQCTWIANIDYYENLQPRKLVQMTVRNKALNSRIKGESYCTLVFFELPQPFNDKGVFLDRSDKKRRRQINGHILRKVNDRVGYAITKQYR
ncbi:hypothetical protein A8C56_13315 [Niabella ginsenosidivorans]|uniref:Lipoprotein n=1 Tax=Niabella ginsenosidivorans TaxID=1176587 RepID=A0A1A9I2D8_9BACT|nr:hypothetical protein [Niabella ginsenosidivorans]ANH81827.1 hypothetical protein A8C56_13315 [Niabella ginsenosidivorans]